MDFIQYFVFSAVYIMVIHFAIAIRQQFNLFLMIAVFAFGMAIGYWTHNYALGFTLAVVLSLVFW